MLVSEDEAVVAAFANRRIEVFVLSLEEYCLRFWSHLSAGGNPEILAMINVKIFTNLGIVPDNLFQYFVHSFFSGFFHYCGRNYSVACVVYSCFMFCILARSS